MKTLLRIMLCIVVVCFLSPMSGMASPTTYDLVGKVWDDNFSSFVWGNMTLGDVQPNPYSTRSYPVESFSISSSSLAFSGNQGSVQPAGWGSIYLLGTLVANGQTQTNNGWSGTPAFFYGADESGLPMNPGSLLYEPYHKAARIDFVSFSGTPLPSSDSPLHGYLYATLVGDAVSAPEPSTLLYVLSGILLSIPMMRKRMWVKS